jgi:hypothetical protein
MDSSSIPDPRQSSTTHPLEGIFAILGAGACLIITILIWRSIGSFQDTWLLPGMYFVELAALSIVSALTFFRDDPRGRFITWGAAGAIGAFSILGALTVGFFYLPIALLFAILSLTWDVRNKQRILPHLGVCLLAGIVQAALMIAAIQFLYPFGG